MYKLVNKEKDSLVVNVLRLIDNIYIPNDLNNTDYQAYLTWLSEGNTPLPAEE